VTGRAERSGRWLARGAAVAAGALPALAFPEPGVWPLAYVGLVPLLLLAARAPTAREAGVRAWLGGAGFLGATHAWLAPVLGPALVVFALLVGALLVPWGVAARALLAAPVTTARVLAATTVLPAAWVLAEAVRSWERLGGPFGLLGSSQWANRPLLAPAALGGVWLVSFLAVAVNAAFAAALVPGARAPARLVAVVVAAAALATGPAFDALRAQPPAGRTLRLGVVQPGVIAEPGARFDAGERATLELADNRPDLIVWGESSVGFDLDARPDLRARLLRLVRRTGADLLVNVDARRASGPGIHKSAVLVRPEGTAGRYDKMRLVPFGEYIPLRPLLGWVERISRAAAEDRLRGTGPVELQARAVRLGPLVCFESAFPDLARQLVRRGAELIAVQSATSTFQDSWAPEQHASFAAVRAVETGHPVVHATLTGATTVVDARGRVLARLGTSRRGAALVPLPLGAAPTPYVRLGDWVPLGSLAVVAAALAAGLLRRRVHVHQPDPAARDRAAPLVGDADLPELQAPATGDRGALDP
jgi:apolipoprotein N-acyltransferase